jgi:GT2 family glycosyltransferase
MDGQGHLATVVIINYDYGQYIADAIDSALGQSYGSVEVLVVDDGSTDISRQTIAKYKDRVRTVFQDNRGQGAAFSADSGKSFGSSSLDWLRSSHSPGTPRYS